MSDRTLELLDEKIAEARENLEVITRDIKQYRDTLAGFELTQFVTDGHLRNLMHLRSLYTGDAAELTPGDVQSADDVIGISIGGLQIGPPEDATEDELAEYAATMRALFDQANHQAVLATTALNERRQRAEQPPVNGVLVATGPRDTEAMPAIEAPAANGDAQSTVHAEIREGQCIHCHGKIVDLGGGPVHEVNARPVCYADDPQSPYAQFADPSDVGPDPEEAATDA